LVPDQEDFLYGTQQEASQWLDYLKNDYFSKLADVDSIINMKVEDAVKWRLKELKERGATASELAKAEPILRGNVEKRRDDFVMWSHLLALVLNNEQLTYEQLVAKWKLDAHIFGVHSRYPYTEEQEAKFKEFDALKKEEEETAKFAKDKADRWNGDPDSAPPPPESEIDLINRCYNLLQTPLSEEDKTEYWRLQSLRVHPSPAPYWKFDAYLDDVTFSDPYAHKWARDLHPLWPLLGNLQLDGDAIEEIVTDLRKLVHGRSQILDLDNDETVDGPLARPVTASDVIARIRMRPRMLLKRRLVLSAANSQTVAFRTLTHEAETADHAMSTVHAGWGYGPTERSRWRHVLGNLSSPPPLRLSDAVKLSTAPLLRKKGFQKWRRNDLPQSHPYGYDARSWLRQSNTFDIYRSRYANRA